MAIAIQRELPERGLHGLSVAPAGQCCCCCCCCLHSVGSVLGAVTAGAPQPTAPPLPVAAVGGPTRPAKYSAAGVYWAMTAILTGVVAAYYAVSESPRPRSGELAILIAVFLPAVQLAASIAAALVILGSNRGGKAERLGHLGRITLRAFVGGLIGGLVMLPMCIR